MIKYNFAELDVLAGGLQGQFKQLESLSDQLKSQVTQLDANWSSPDAKTAYLEAQNNWDRVFVEAREQLLGIERGVRNAADTMRTTDSNIGRTFTA